MKPKRHPFSHLVIFLFFLKDGHDAFAIATLRDYKDIVKLIRKFRAGHLSVSSKKIRIKHFFFERTV